MKEIPKKIKNQNKREENSSDDNSDNEKYKQIKDEVKGVKKKPKNIGKMLKLIVHKSSKTKNAILSKIKEPFEKIKAEEKEKEILNKKKELKQIQKKLGYTAYDKWDKKFEKKLLKTTTRGVVKLFNSIFEFRKKAKEEKIEEEKKIDKKGSNFLMMHNLDPSFNSKFKKQFKEDNDDDNDNNDNKYKINNQNDENEDDEQ